MSLGIRHLRTLLLLRALTLLWLCRLALWLLPFRAVTRWVDRSRVRPAAAGVGARQIAQVIRTTARFVPHPTCLVRALAGARLFAEQGQRVRLVIGARKRAAGLEAHAWLEAGGQVLLGNVGDLHSYHPLGRAGEI